jgi:biotin carboxylase
VSTAVIVLPSGTYRAEDFVEAARSLGVDLIVASDAEAAFEDDRYLHIDCADPRRSADIIVEAGDRHPIDAVIPVDDAGVMTAALAAELLGLRHNPPPAVAATLNKAMLRRALLHHEIPQPAFELATPASDVVALVEFVGTPVVLKPLSFTGGTGVIKVDHPLQAPIAADRIRRILAVAGKSPNEPILIERYQDGAEVTVEGLLVDGHLTVLALFDKPDQTAGPFFEETMLVTPSRLHPEIIEEIQVVASRAVSALGLREGPIHAEFRVDGSRVVVIEVAARSIGGLCSRSLHFGLLGTTLEHLLLRHALGMRIETRREELASGVLMVPVPRAGRFRTIGGVDAARVVPGITTVTVTAPTGTHVLPLPDASRYLGFLFATGPTPDSVETSLRTAQSRLEVVVDAD